MQVRAPCVQFPMTVPSVTRPQLPGDMAPTALEQAGVNMNFSAKGDLPFFSAKDPKNAAALQNASQFNDVTSRDLGNVAAATVGTMAGMTGGPTAVRGGLQVVKAAAKASPYVAASEGINYLRQKAGKAGKFIPPGAEMIPYFMMGAKGAPEAPAAAEGEAAASVPRGTSSE